MTRVGGRHLTKFALGLATVTLLMGCEGGGGTLIEGRYLIQGSGDTVLDTVTGLEWERCSRGQEWNGSICIREARTVAGFQLRPNPHWQPPEKANPWRTPTKEELRTLVYCSNGNPARFKDSDEKCYGNHQVPTIVEQAFPNTPSTWFWSSSPYDDGGIKKQWGVNFSNGQLGGTYGSNALRRVRDGEQR